MKNTRVYVGLSGGVDSSVTAALLKERGFDVVGVYLRPWQPDFIPCTWRQDRRDAMRVAAHLNIPFLELDTSEAYKKEVVDYMINGYKRGITPNPDILCNKEIKFGIFRKWVDENGGGIIATGHYVQAKDGQLLCAVDPLKDQSYFLAGVSPEVLTKTMFPLGGMHKTETRKLAEKYKLPTRAKKDSQGVCFLGMVDMKDFLQHYISFTPGDVVNEKGEVIGRHDDARLYTLGERHGFTVFDEYKKSHAWYVVKRDIGKNLLTVATSFVQEDGERPYVVLLRDVVDHGISEIEDGKFEAQLRYHGQRYALEKHDLKTGYVTVKSSERPTEGQMLVVYEDKRVVLGGVIDKVL